MSHLHKKRSLRLSAALLVLALLAVPALFGARLPDKVKADSADALRDQIAAAQAEQERLQAQIDALSEEEAQSAENKQLYDQLSGTTQNKIYLSQNLLTQLENQISMTETDIEALKAKLDSTMERYLARVKDTWEDGNASYIELILGSESITDFLSRIDRLNAILEYDRDLMKSYEDDMATLEQKKADLETMRSTEAETKAQLEADQAYYDQLADAEVARMNSLLAHQSDLEAQYNAAYQAELAASAELEEVIARFQAQSQVTYNPSSGFIRPIAQGVGYISCSFGEADPGGNPHRGYDIACAAGTPIMAAASGVVITSGWHWSWGNYIVIDHGNGFSTLYAHCSALIASAGQYVEQGETVGLVGTTGYSFGNHVHVEFYVGGALSDGAAYIPF